MNVNIFKQKANTTHSHKFDYSLVTSVRKVSDKIDIICPVHGKFSQRANSHLSGFGCKKCSASKANEDKKITKSIFLDRAQAKHKNKYDYSEIIYKDYNTKISIICPEHGRFNQLPSSHVSGSGCPDCGIVKAAKNSKIGINKFIEISNAVHSNKYDYSQSIYEAFDSKIKIICPEHGIFEKEASLHMNGKGCPKCNLQKGNAKKTVGKDVFIERAVGVHGNTYDYSCVNYTRIDKDVVIICPEHGRFMQRPDNHLAGSGCRKCTKVTSKMEMSISELVPGSILNTRGVITNELDVYSDEFKLAIEYDGVLWHSYGTTFPNNYKSLNKNRHLTKTEECGDLDIDLFHIFDTEYKDAQLRKIWNSMISNKVGESTRLYARKCEIREISVKEARLFLDENHLQGYANSRLKIGLFNGSDLVCVMTIGKPRYNNNYEWEIIRIATKLNHNVVGGVSKMLKYFEREYNPKNILSYANRRWSRGNVYEKLGFKFIRNTVPNHFYTDGNNVFHREQYQKHKLKGLLPDFDNSKTGVQNMVDNGYRILYDCGNKLYVKEY